MQSFTATFKELKMADQNLADINPPFWEKWLFMSHPPIKERIQNSENKGRSLS